MAFHPNKMGVDGEVGGVMPLFSQKRVAARAISMQSFREGTTHVAGLAVGSDSLRDGRSIALVLVL